MAAVSETPCVRWNYGTAEEISSTRNLSLLKKPMLLLHCIFWHPFFVRFESCWPALMKDSNGVVIVFNDDVPSHTKEVETWHSTFVASQGLRENQCLIVVHHKPGSGANTSPPPLGNTFQTILLILYRPKLHEVFLSPLSSKFCHILFACSTASEQIASHSFQSGGRPRGCPPGVSTIFGECSEDNVWKSGPWGNVNLHMNT